MTDPRLFIGNKLRVIDAKGLDGYAEIVGLSEGDMEGFTVRVDFPHTTSIDRDHRDWPAGEDWFFYSYEADTGDNGLHLLWDIPATLDTEDTPTVDVDDIFPDEDESYTEDHTAVSRRELTERAALAALPALIARCTNRIQDSADHCVEQAWRIGRLFADHVTDNLAK